MRMRAVVLGVLIALAGGFAVLPHPGAARADETARGDDGWRRTAHGWERITALRPVLVPTGGVSASYVPPAPDKSRERLDVHPGVLLIGQLMVAGSALLLAQSRRLAS